MKVRRRSVGTFANYYIHSARIEVVVFLSSIVLREPMSIVFDVFFEVRNRVYDDDIKLHNAKPEKSWYN